MRRGSPRAFVGKSARGPDIGANIRVDSLLDGVVQSGQDRTIYGTLDPYAALAESVGIYGHYNIPFEQRLPLVLVAIDVRLVRVLDLTNGKLRRHLGVSEERMLLADWKTAETKESEGITQMIGRLAWEANIEALIVPSLKLKKERNRVVFPDQLQKPSHLKIVNCQELPEPR